MRKSNALLVFSVTCASATGQAPIGPRGERSQPSGGRTAWLRLLAMLAGWVALCSLGCAVTPETLSVRGHPIRMMANTILHTETAAAVPRQALLAELAHARVIYVGETHTNPFHHAIQLQIVEALAQTTADLMIGMEMFDHTYQPVLDRWIAGHLDETAFLQQTHWYANWRFDYGLYRDILEFAKKKSLRIVALNVPFHLPGKISVGGIASLSPSDRRLLPATVDTTDPDHRAYIAEIFKMHRVPGRVAFDFFYEAQCTWEDGMAEAVATHLGDGKMVVLAGNGHIIRKFGIPNRAFARTRAPFKTIYLAPIGAEVDRSWADYIWVTPQTPSADHPMRGRGQPSP